MAWQKRLEMGRNKMQNLEEQISDIEAIQKAWLAFTEVIGFTSVRTESDYERARAIIDALLDTVGDDGEHPLADLLDYLGNQVEKYEDKHFPNIDAS
jgi:HTH-type transcriptional regulator/antitoxin HigA